MRNLIKKSTIILFAILIAGCTSRPREVVASLPLVSPSQQKPTAQEIPEQYWPDLANAATTSLIHEKYQIIVSPLYVSALGQPCRELSITGLNTPETKRVACEIAFINDDKQQDKAWFLAPQIIESTRYVEL
jgi:hypothetical protein